MTEERLLELIAYEAEGSREKHAEDTVQNILLLIGEHRGHLEFQEDYDRAEALRNQLVEDFEPDGAIIKEHYEGKENA